MRRRNVQAAQEEEKMKPVTVINYLVVKPGKMDEFIDSATRSPRSWFIPLTPPLGRRRAMDEPEPLRRKLTPALGV